MQAVNIKFTIETLEDFHIGTGLDCVGLYDDGQVKDKDGNPYINPETLKGLLKQSCLEIKRNLSGYTDAFDELFFFKNLGSLDLFITYKTCDGDSPFIIHTFTAIDDKTGTGKDGSLRDIEFGSKGCKFDVELHFEMKNDNEKNVKNLLEFGIKNLKWMGGYRRRGFGAIKCSIIENWNPETSKKEIIHAKKLRLFLELKDDACFAGAGQTGNIIHSLDYINGTSVLGMLRNPMLKLYPQESSNDPKFLDDGNVSVTNFYPIAKKWNENLKLKVVIPAPSSLRKNKGVDQFADYYCDHRDNSNGLEIPHWALDAKPKNGNKEAFKNAWRMLAAAAREAKNGNKEAFKNIVSQDTLIDDKDTDQDGASDKSISGEYLVFTNNSMKWEEAVFFKPKKNLIMRNRITESTQSTDDDGIFTQEMIEKGTIFVGEIEFNNVEDSKKFQTKLQDWLEGKFYFHAGRGGKALKVKALEEVIELPEIDENKINTKQFTITLLSDVVLYDEKLMLETVIHPEYLDLKGKVKLINNISSNRIHQSFSGLAGLRRFSDRVISKGSCFLYELEDNTKWNEIRIMLEKLQTDGIGYKKDEGFGQIAINLSVHQITKAVLQKGSYEFDIDEAKHPVSLKLSLEKRENDYINAKKFDVKYPNDSKNFVNRIISYMEAGKKEQDITDEIDKNIKKNTRAADNWKVFNDKIWGKTKDYNIIRLAHLIIKQEVK